MSNYTLAVNWSGKDALADSDAAKVISGDDFNTEFTTVQTAVNSKADLNGSSSEDFAMDNGTVGGTFAVTGTTTLGGNPTTTTQSAGNDTTRIATTEFVTAAVAAVSKAVINGYVYPIGSIFTTTSHASAPATTPEEVATLIGVGTWEAFGEGRVLIGTGSTADSQPTPETVAFAAAATGGEFNHTLTTDEMPAHTHTTTHGSGGGATHCTSSQSSAESCSTNPTSSTGGGSVHNNLQPYIVVYFWKRTA
jgi:hypothetical protein